MSNIFENNVVNTTALPMYSTKIFTDIWMTADEFLSDYHNTGIPTMITDESARTLFYLLYAKYGNSPIANRDETQFKYKMFGIIFQYGPTWEKELEIQRALRDLDLEALSIDITVQELFDRSGNSLGSSNLSTTANVSITGKDTTTSTSTTTGNSETTGTRAGTDTMEGNDIDVRNHAYNPSTEPGTDAFEALDYINEQNAGKITKSGTTTASENTSGTSESESNTEGTQNLNREGTESHTGENTGSDTNQYEDNTEGTRTTKYGALKAYAGLIELLKKDVSATFLSKFAVCFKKFVSPDRIYMYISELEEAQYFG